MKGGKRELGRIWKRKSIEFEWTCGDSNNNT